jgi:ATP-binding cassette, subfamily B, bacterial
VARFYSPLQQLASIWSNFQMASAGWDRISEILAMETNLTIVTNDQPTDLADVLELKGVSFGYQPGQTILHQVSLTLNPGKTYASVGPTGGGKTTTASLMARLYDPIEGQVLLHGRDIRSYTDSQRSQQIGFILQDPFLFGGTIKENILYGNAQYANYSTKELEELLQQQSLTEILERFDQGLETPVTSGESISLGQRQLIAFIRAVLRQPSLLILDEATANIDTVTEQLLGKALDLLPETTARVIIAHRLNTIRDADEIFFVNNGTIIPAGSLDGAIQLLQKGIHQT